MRPLGTVQTQTKFHSIRLYKQGFSPLGVRRYGFYNYLEGEEEYFGFV